MTNLPHLLDFLIATLAAFTGIIIFILKMKCIFLNINSTKQIYLRNLEKHPKLGTEHYPQETIIPTQNLGFTYDEVRLIIPDLSGNLLNVIFYFFKPHVCLFCVFSNGYSERTACFL